MMNLFQFFRHEPALGGIVLFCLLLVGGVVLSDWLEKRRTRKLLKLRDELKELNLRGGRDLEPEPIRHSTAQHRGFRIFRWEFVLLSVICVGIWMPFSKKSSAPVQARSHAEADGTMPKKEPTPESTAASPAIQEPLIAFTVSSPKVSPGKIRLRLLDSGNVNSGTDEPRFHSSLLGSLRRTTTEHSVDVSALFQENPNSEELDALEPAALSPRDVYPIGNNGFTPNDPRKRMSFSKR
jgi:hypothetical protein